MATTLLDPTSTDIAELLVEMSDMLSPLIFLVLEPQLGGVLPTLKGEEEARSRSKEEREKEISICIRRHLQRSSRTRGSM